MDRLNSNKEDMMDKEMELMRDIITLLTSFLTDTLLS